VKHGPRQYERRWKNLTGSDYNQEKRTYTVREVAELLGISNTAAYSLVKKQAFKTVRIGTAIRISKASFDEWLDAQS